MSVRISLYATLARTPQGRVLTAKGYHAIGLKPLAGGDQQPLL